MEFDMDKLMEELVDRLVPRLVEALLERLGPALGGRRGEARLLDVEEAAERLGRTVPAVYKLVERGRLPAVRVDQRLQISSAVLDAFVAGDLAGAQAIGARQAERAARSAGRAGRAAPVRRRAPVERRHVVPAAEAAERQQLAPAIRSEAPPAKPAVAAPAAPAVVARGELRAAGAASRTLAPPQASRPGFQTIGVRPGEEGRVVSPGRPAGAPAATRPVGLRRWPSLWRQLTKPVVSGQPAASVLLGGPAAGQAAGASSGRSEAKPGASAFVSMPGWDEPIATKGPAVSDGPSGTSILDGLVGLDIDFDDLGGRGGAGGS